MKYVKRLWTLISGEGFRDEAPKDINAAKAASIRNLLNNCPVCRDGFLEHSYALFATTVLGEEQERQTLEFFKVLKDHKWSESLKFQKWEGLSDNVEAYAIHCPTGRVAVLVVRSLFELDYNDELLTLEVLDNGSGQELLSLISEKQWKPL